MHLCDKEQTTLYIAETWLWKVNSSIIPQWKSAPFKQKDDENNELYEYLNKYQHKFASKHHDFS